MIRPIPIPLALVLSVLVLSAASAFAQEPSGLIQRLGEASLDWGTGSASAFAVMTTSAEASDRERGLAEREAALAARKGLLDLLSAVRVDAQATAAQVLAGNEAARRRVFGLVQASELVRRRLDPETVEAVASLSLHGPVADALLPASPQFFTAPVPAAGDAAPGEEAAAVSGHTGLIVDARGFGAVPGLLPSILDGAGRLLYGPSLVGREATARLGLVGYAPGPGAASLKARVGGKPLVVRAGGVRGGGLDLVIGRQDSARARALLQTKDVLAGCRVGVILDPPAPPAQPEPSASAGQASPTPSEKTP